MNPIATYLFLDLGTTGLRNLYSEPDITRLRVVAVKRRDLLSKMPVEWPRHIEKRYKPEYESEAEISYDVFHSIQSMINDSEKPVCLVAHYGFEFHFPILQYYFKMINKTITDDVMCTDSLYAFYDILEAAKAGRKIEFPSSLKMKTQSFLKLKRDRFYGENGAPTESYHYEDVYDRVVGNFGDETRNCYMIMDVAEAAGERFVEWVDWNHCHFAEVLI